MDNYVYNNLAHYFKALESTGYYRYKDVYKLLILLFWYHLLYEDYRGYMTREDYKTIEKALNCFYGTSCLIPYTDYLKMGKLKLGGITELLARTKEMEDLVKNYDQRILDNDALIADNTKRIDEQGTRVMSNEERITTLEDTKVIKKKYNIENMNILVPLPPPDEPLLT